MKLVRIGGIVNEKVFVQIKIDKSLKKEWQRYCLERDISLTELIKRAVEDFLLVNK